MQIYSEARDWVRRKITIHIHISADSRVTGLLVVITALSFLPLEFTQLAFSVAGACVYTLLQYAQEHHAWWKGKRPVPTTGSNLKLLKDARTPAGRHVRRTAAQAADTTPKVASRTFSRTGPSPIQRQVTAEPQLPFSLSSKSWEADVQLLLGQIIPTSDSQITVSKLAATVRSALRPLFPEADVSGFVSSELSGSRAFRVAVPDVELVVSVNPDVLSERLQSRLGANLSPARRLDPRQLEKAAIRSIADTLVSSCGFKFRRSAFRGEEPKLTLLAPAFLGVAGEAVPLDLSVNALTPLHNAALLSECGQIDERARDLILLVRRWAKDRGICHAAKGYPSPYHWSLLVIYFLQVQRPPNEGAILPPLADFRAYQALMRPAAGLLVPKATGDLARAPEPRPIRRKVSPAKLFKDFMHFYAHFNWQNEAVSLLSGQRGVAPMPLPPRDGSGDADAGLCVQDPFRPESNLRPCCTASSFERVKEELRRTSSLCSEGATMKQVFEPWSPLAQEDEE